MAANRPVLEISEVSLEYGSRDGPVVALEQVNLAIEEGEFICVVGPSGCCLAACSPSTCRGAGPCTST